ncbi:bacterioferritin [Bermanella marisrubri]|uniref:Bacterioferritin n=1 Tax=Bermanella marisrubri TaxID=207949 RepID=Q1N3D5_9GAMM|nr:bacterioferritin [Bermanella marisrubri]EAT12656.1 bacterioferritin [Oceanobacter sp. RED65] [Bermanella marisrubri]QIZ85219.1 bacterioferritin [Bermanella marisrubri]
MKSTSDILDALNGVLTTELTSINHYFLHARMFRNWGFENLDKVAYKKSIKDMKQADELIERILMLEGLPNLQRLSPLKVGEQPKEMITLDETFQHEQIDQLKSAIALCEEKKDFVSRGILSEILEYEEDYLDFVETQLHQIDAIGIENYLQSQLEEDE